MTTKFSRRGSSVRDVGEWLKANGMVHLIEKFAVNAVSGEDLQRLSEDDLILHLGCTPLQARKILREFNPQAGPRISDPPPPSPNEDTPTMNKRNSPTMPSSPYLAPMPPTASSDSTTPTAFVSVQQNPKVSSFTPPFGYNQSQYIQPVPQQYIPPPPPPQQQVLYYAPVPHENYCGPWSWVICCCLGFPCIACCPVDQRPIECYPRQMQMTTVIQQQVPAVVDGLPCQASSPSSSMQMQR
jgi:SAM domain (Sterile alpha motif)